MHLAVPGIVQCEQGIRGVALHRPFARQLHGAVLVIAGPTGVERTESGYPGLAGGRRVG